MAAAQERRRRVGTSAVDVPAPAGRAGRETPRSPLRRLWVIVRATARAYFADHVSRLGAALAFYTTVAVAPLLVLAVSVAGIFFEDHTARERVLAQIRQLIGSQAAEALAVVQPAAPHHGTAVFAAWIGGATLLLGALGVFAHLQDALNAIWHSPRPGDESLFATLRRRAFSFGTVVATGFLMLVSLVVSAVLTWIGENANHWSLPAGLWESLNFVLSLAVITFLFATLFKLLPDVTVRWRDVWVGAAVTAVLFVAGKTLLGLYLARASMMSSYGAAGSIVVLLVWCYYAAQILFVGAEFTRMQAATEGGRIDPPKD